MAGLEHVTAASAALRGAIHAGFLLLPVLEARASVSHDGNALVDQEVRLIAVPDPDGGPPAVAAFTSRTTLAASGLDPLHRCACPDPKQLGCLVAAESRIALDIGTTSFVLTDLSELVTIWEQEAMPAVVETWPISASRPTRRVTND